MAQIQEEQLREQLSIRQQQFNRVNAKFKLGFALVELYFDSPKWQALDKLISTTTFPFFFFFDPRAVENPPG